MQGVEPATRSAGRQQLRGSSHNNKAINGFQTCKRGINVHRFPEKTTQFYCNDTEIHSKSESFILFYRRSLCSFGVYSIKSLIFLLPALEATKMNRKSVKGCNNSLQEIPCDIRGLFWSISAKNGCTMCWGATAHIKSR